MLADLKIALLVFLLVLGVTVAVGITAYMVDRSTARQERKE